MGMLLNLLQYYLMFFICKNTSCSLSLFPRQRSCLKFCLQSVHSWFRQNWNTGKPTDKLAGSPFALFIASACFSNKTSFDAEYIYGFVRWGGLQAKSMTSQRAANKMADMRYYDNVMTTTRWRLFVTMFYIFNSTVIDWTCYIFIILILRYGIPIVCQYSVWRVDKIVKHNYIIIIM